MTETRSAVLSARELAVSFGALRALDGLSFDVVSGRMLGIIGPNGAGKSTAFNAITNVVSHSGSAVLKGEDISAVPTQDLARRGLKRTFQQNSFFGELTVLENAVCALHASHASSLAESLFLPLREMRRRALAEEAAASLLSAFEIDERWFAQLPGEIPYGTQRLLSVALAYGDGAEVLLLDEPAAGIGGNDMTALSLVLRRLKEQGVALVLIEHHMDLIMALADEIVVLDQGRQIATGTPEAVRQNPAVREAYLGREQE